MGSLTTAATAATRAHLIPLVGPFRFGVSKRGAPVASRKVKARDRADRVVLDRWQPCRATHGTADGNSCAHRGKCGRDPNTLQAVSSSGGELERAVQLHQHVAASCVELQRECLRIRRVCIEQLQENEAIVKRLRILRATVHRRTEDPGA
jgi:hypothetical protein